jgi:flagellar motor switch protein FliN/FliY
MKTDSVSAVKVPVQAVLGEIELSLAEIAAIKAGSVLELRRLAGEPVDLVAGDLRVGRGEVVVIEESFGIRVTEVLE